MAKSINIKGTKHQETIAQFAELVAKYDTTQAQALSYLLSLTDFKREVKGNHKIEGQLKEWLFFGHSKVITQSELARVTASRPQICKELIELYASEIEEHNAKFNG